MFAYLALTDGTTLLDLTDGQNYALVSYAPAITARNQNELGPIYADVVDTLTFHAIGCTPADAYAAVEAATKLLDQAWRWSQSEPVSTVRIQIQLQGTALALPLEAVVKGRPPGSGDGPISAPEQRDEYAGKYLIQNVQIQFVRAGPLLYPTAETGTPSAAAAAPTVHTVTITTPTTISSPTKLAYNFSQLGVIGSYNVEYAYVLWASAASRLQIYEAESIGLGTNVASVADAAAFARGGSVARYSPGVLLTTIGGTVFVGFDTTSRRMAVWAAVRNNSATTNFTIQATISGGAATASGPVIPIDTSTLNPRLIFLGIVASQVAWDTFIFNLTASAAAGTLDIDYVIFQAVDDETSGAVLITPPSGTTYVGASPLTIDPRPLTALVPIITSVPASTNPTPMGYAGSPIVLTRSSFVTCLMGKTLGNFWRVVGGVTVADTAVASVARFGAYLTPR